MSTGSPMDLKYARWLSGHLIERLGPFLERLEVAGSIRRGKETVGDVELVGVPVLNEDLFGDGATPVLEGLMESLREISTIEKAGARYIRAHLLKTGQTLDLFLVHPPAQWGSIMAIRTGPDTLSRWVVTKCQERGIRHTDGHAVQTDTGEVIPTATEEQFFALAGMECPDPEEREALGLEVWKAGE
jgi:DNA polymerase (family 10)